MEAALLGRDEDVEGDVNIGIGTRRSGGAWSPTELVSVWIETFLAGRTENGSGGGWLGTRIRT
jgi:hypothetical protein